MLYRTALLSLAPPIPAYVAEVSRRRREHLRREMLALYALLEQHGEAALAAAMTQAALAGAYGAEYLTALLAPWPALPPATPPLSVPGVPSQAEVDRLLSSYEAWVQVETTRERPVACGVPA